MGQMIGAWAAGTVCTLALDVLWVGVLANAYYKKELGHLMADKVSWPPVFAFYAIYGVGLAYFCALPALQDASLKRAIINGALLGAVVYGTYDFTNMALLRNWGGAVSALDIAWGVFLTATAAAASFCAARALA